MSEVDALCRILGDIQADRQHQSRGASGRKHRRDSMTGFHSLHPGTDVLACPDCGGRLRFLATIEDRALIEKILGHLDLPVDARRAAPARVAGWLPGVDAPADWITE